MCIQEAADTVTPLRDETGIRGVVVKGSMTFQNADSSLLRVIKIIEMRNPGGEFLIDFSNVMVVDTDGYDALWMMMQELKNDADRGAAAQVKVLGRNGPFSIDQPQNRFDLISLVGTPAIKED
jgi:MFS superfamily sulfate permease-like transporter